MGNASASLSVRIPQRLINLINTALGILVVPALELFLCDAEAAHSVGRLGYLGSTLVIPFDVLMLVVIFHWPV